MSLTTPLESLKKVPRGTGHRVLRLRPITFSLMVDKTDVIVGECVTYTATISEPFVSLVIFNLFDASTPVPGGVSVVTAPDGVGIVTNGWAGFHLFSIAPAVRTGANTITAGVFGEPTLIDSKVITVTDPGTFNCPDPVAYLNSHGMGISGVLTGSFTTFGPGLNAAYTDTTGGINLQLGDLRGTMIVYTTLVNIPLDGVGRWVWTKSDSCPQCPRGTYTLTDDPLGGAPASITVT